LLLQRRQPLGIARQRRHAVAALRKTARDGGAGARADAGDSASGLLVVLMSFSSQPGCGR
jgi:hypothetical protein